jgi:hypothetical protein
MEKGTTATNGAVEMDCMIDLSIEQSTFVN